MELGALYFYTATIHKWRPLIRQYHFHSTIIDSLSFLHQRNCLKVYGFVIMPNHIHLIWQLLKQNGRETPVASFMKHTAHCFESHIALNNPADLGNYQVNWRSRKYNFWQPEPDWFLLHREKTVIQKLNYIHNNPLQDHWRLVKNAAEYPFSSARFYETGQTDVDFLYDYRDFGRLD